MYECVQSLALVGRDRDGGGFYEALAAAGVRVKKRDFALRSDSDVAQHNAIRAGLGIGAMQVPLAARTPWLRRVLPRIGFAMPM